MSKGRGRSEQELVGEIRSWKDPWGFVVCREFGGDLFAHRDAFVGPVPGGDLAGQRVRFTRSADTKGRPAAGNISFLNGGGAARSSAARPYGHIGGGGRSATPIGAVMHRGAAATPVAAAGHHRAGAEQLRRLVGTRLKGEIRSWKGDWGFITSQRFSGDVFVHQHNTQLDPSQLIGGTKVTFCLKADNKGRWTADEVTPPIATAEELIGAGVFEGKVRSWKGEWGFISAPDHFDGDLFCHKDALTDPELAKQDRRCSFEIGTDKRGRPCASNVNIDDTEDFSAPDDVGNGGLAADDDEGEVMTGTIRSWKEPWGFVVNPERFEGDLFCHRDAFVEAPPVGQDLTGSTVEFRKGLDSKRRPAANEVSILELGDGAAVQEFASLSASTSSSPRTPRAPKGSSKGSSKGGRADDAALFPLIGEHLEGTVRSWKAEWGFIQSDHFEGDLFAHKDNLAGGALCLAVGAQVAFEVGTDSKERCMALGVRSLHQAKDWMNTESVLQGEFRSWKEAWGFIVSPGSFEGDLFAHIENFVSPVASGLQLTGMKVSFVVSTDRKGRCVAAEMQLAESREAGPRRDFRKPAVTSSVVHKRGIQVIGATQGSVKRQRTA